MKSLKNLAQAMVIIIAVGAAIATAPIKKNSFSFPGGAGYSANENNTLVPEENRVPMEIQNQLCVFRLNCAGGDFPCRVIVAGESYGIYDRSIACHIVLGEPAP